MSIQQRKNWGNRPWTVDFAAPAGKLPDAVDFAVVGGGFTGLATAAWLKRLAPEKSVALLEAQTFGSGASGHTGGLALAESAAGDLPGLGDVLAGYGKIVDDLRVGGDFELTGVYELGRQNHLGSSPIRWNDSGTLAAVKEVPGGTVDPGKTVTGLARAAYEAGALLFEHAGVDSCDFDGPIRLHSAKGVLRAGRVLFATNAYAFELTGWTERVESCFTIAVATEELSDETLRAAGLADGMSFYTVDLPYLWGRPLGDRPPGRRMIFGAGLVHFEDWREVESLNIAQGEIAQVYARLERRIHNFHPALRNVAITHRWGGPIGIAEDGWKPIFERHPRSDDAIVLGAYSGHGVAQSVYLGAWAAEALLGRRELPKWR